MSLRSHGLLSKENAEIMLLCDIKLVFCCVCDSPTIETREFLSCRTRWVHVREFLCDEPFVRAAQVVCVKTQRGAQVQALDGIDIHKHILVQANAV